MTEAKGSPGATIIAQPKCHAEERAAVHAMSWKAKTIVALLLIVTVLPAMTCSPERDAKYTNHTERILVLTEEGFELGRLLPGETRSFRVRKDLLPSEIVAKSEDGTVIFERLMTWQDLKDSQFRVDLE